MKFLKTACTILYNKAKNTLANIQNTVKDLHTSTQKLNHIVQPFLKKIVKEKVSFPFVRLQVNKGIAIAASYIGIHFLEFGLMHYFSTFGNQTSAEIEKTNQNSKDLSTTNTTISHLAIACGSLLIKISLFSIRRSLSYYLRNSVEFKLKNKMAQTWLSNKTSAGITYLQEIEGNELLLPISEIFSHHIAMCSKSVSYVIDITDDSLSIFINAFFLKKMLDKPKALIYLLAYGFLIAVAQHKIFYKGFENVFTDISTKSSEITEQVTNVQQFGAQTIAFNGEQLTRDKLLNSFRDRELLARRLHSLETKSQVIMSSLNQVLTPFLDFAFPEHALLSFTDRSWGYFYNQSISNIMNRILNLSTLLTQELPAVRVSIDQVSQFDRLMKQWDNFNKLELLKQDFNSKAQDLVLSDFKVHIFNNSKKDTIDNAAEILKTPNLLWGNMTQSGVSQTFKKGKVYLFPDLSGSGKTTILKAILGMYPLACGRVLFPCKANEISYISRNIFLPIKRTLLETITFPSIIKKEEEKSICELNLIYIKRLGFVNPERYRDALLETAEWSSKLSDGEKQRFALIGVLIKKPKVLVLDEAFGGLDVPSKFLVEKVIKEELKNSIILYADHHPIPGFVDYVIKINNGDLTCIKETDYDYSYQKYMHIQTDSKSKL